MKTENKKYKDSGIPWIGEIPEDWDIRRIKNIGHSQNGLTYSPSDMVSENEGVLVLRSSNIQNGKLTFNDNVYVSADIPSNLMVKKGDLIICSRNGSAALVGKCALVEDDNLNATYGAFMMRFNSRYNSRYTYYLLSTAISQYKQLFFTTTINQLTVSTFDGLRVPFTESLPTQQRIADFLDRKCAEIDELSALQETMIAELKRYKQSVITEAVTKGLDKNVKFKDSGVEWIGEIPEGWEVKKVKNITTEISKGNGITKEEVFADGDTPCVRYGEIYSKYDNSFVNCFSKTKKDVLPTLHYFGKGDILCAGTGELVEEIGKSIVYLGENQCLAGGDIIVLRHCQNPLFLNFALNSNYAQAQKSCSKAKLKVVHISAFNIGNILIAFPPLCEQQAIADYLDEKCSEIDELIAIKQQKIEQLKEYKKSVIFEYVTGKKEVL